MSGKKINIEINDEDITSKVKEELKHADEVHIHKSDDDGEEVDIDINIIAENLNTPPIVDGGNYDPFDENTLVLLIADAHDTTNTGQELSYFWTPLLENDRTEWENLYIDTDTTAFKNMYNDTLQFVMPY